MTPSPSDLAHECTAAVRNGKSFPTVWHSMLRGHALLEGIPRERFRGRPLLFIPLNTGQELVYDRTEKEFRLE
jgi:hypothetical protein